MKHVFLFSALFLAGVFAVNAQDINKPQTSANVGMTPVQKGNWIVGGSLGSLGYSFEGENFNIMLNPRAGYFISDGVAIGLGLIGSLATVPDEDDVWGYGVSPFVRYYFPQGSSATGRFFAQGDVGISGSSPGSGASLALGANVGYAHFITSSVALEVTAGYNYSKATVSGSTGQSGLGVALGFQVYLPGQR
ncbi:hypothetical protein [Parapedobacter indicus]|uniref:Outer membrane protein beta-barrel domain-containing protein n=1 Tax=Parapedobacter indicus TaxID=1477437 RepID=A0A1I3J7E2_9SPHI|nr:hypothetical protein [Parapedobacter indicus]PPL02423.1 hypothetical protein CLV26_104348 [Parapedobacter indicus]SFI56234.1 hypothetical protein SAMN05444682_104347 [Parapedobacter indicus]